MAAASYVRSATTSASPPPLTVLGPLGLARANLFSSLPSSLTTLALIGFLLWLLPPLVGWASWRAIWSAPDGALCRAHQDGACWAFIAQKLQYLLYGSYPVGAHWRVALAEILGGALIAWLLWPNAPRKGIGSLAFFLVYPVVAFVLLHGSTALGLAP